MSSESWLLPQGAEGSGMLAAHGLGIPPCCSLGVAGTSLCLPGKGPVEVSDPANPRSRTVANARSERLGLKDFQGWSPLLSGYVSQGCTTLPRKEFFLMSYLNWPGCNLSTLSLTYCKDFGSILPVSALQVTVDFS